MKRCSHQFALSGLFLAIGIILPYFTAHMLAIPGTLLLPMHIPVILCGLICGMCYGAICGILIPILSSVISGMPVFYPMLPIIIVQLFAMGIISGILYKKVKFPIYISLLGAMVSGWIFYGLVFTILQLFETTNIKALLVTAAVIQGLPGIGVQLVLIPILVKAIEKYQGRAKHENINKKDLLIQALRLLKNGNVSCVVIHGDKIVHTDRGPGVSPLLKIYQKDPELLKSAFVVDKIIGKAAAMILVLGGVQEVFGEIMSIAARDYLTKHEVVTQFGRCVNMITNRNQHDICPIERSVMDTDNPKEGLERMTDTIKNLMKQVG